MSCNEFFFHIPFIAVYNWVLKIDHISIIKILVEYKVNNTLVKFYDLLWTKNAVVYYSRPNKVFLSVYTLFIQIYPGFESDDPDLSWFLSGENKNNPNCHKAKHNCIYRTDVFLEPSYKQL